MNVLGVFLIQAFGFDIELAVVMRKLGKHESFEDSRTLYRQYEKRADDGSILVTEVMPAPDSLIMDQHEAVQ